MLHGKNTIESASCVTMARRPAPLRRNNCVGITASEYLRRNICVGISVSEYLERQYNAMRQEEIFEEIEVKLLSVISLDRNPGLQEDADSPY